MALSFQVIQPSDDPNGGRVKINYNFSLLTNANGLSDFDIVSGEVSDNTLRLRTQGGDDIDIVLPQSGNRVISGFNSTYTDETHIDIELGSYVINGLTYTTSGTINLEVTPITLYGRIDAIVGDSNSQLSILQGTENKNPIAPTIPEDKVLISYIFFATQDLNFNGNRTVKRANLPAINAGGTTLIEWVENYFFPFIPATLSINTHSLKEIGTTYTPTINYNITLNDETIVTSGKIIDVTDSNTIIYNVPTPSANASFVASTVTTNNTWKNEAVVDNNGSPTTIVSNNSSVSFIYPWFYGMSADSNLSGTDAYTGLTKSLQTQSDKSVTFNDTSKYIYIFTPSTWGNITEIKDQNGFNVTSSFSGPTLTNVTSIGLDTNYSLNFKMYKTQTVTTVNNKVFTIKF